MHFPATDNVYDQAFPPSGALARGMFGGEASAEDARPTRAPGTVGRVLRGGSVFVGSFVAVFALAYVVVTWPLARDQAGYFISQLGAEQEQATAATTTSAPSLDSDGDGYTDGEELAAGFDPMDAAPTLIDADNDGIRDAVEARYYGTDPASVDSDGDGYSDLEEIVNGYSPLKAADYDRWVADRESAVLRIPKLNIEAPVIWNKDLDKIYDDLTKGVVRYRSTANPGEVGNSVIVGHSSSFFWESNKYGTVFALLDKLKPGDKILVDYMQKTYVYVVSESEVTEPDDTRRFAPTGEPILTLMSCYPAGQNSKRIFVEAALVDAQPVDRSE